MLKTQHCFWAALVFRIFFCHTLLMPRLYGKQDIILKPGIDRIMDDEDVSEEQILKVFNDPDHRDEETDPNTIERFFDSRSNPRTIQISFYKGHSLRFAYNLYREAEFIVIESITVKKALPKS